MLKANLASNGLDSRVFDNFTTMSGGQEPLDTITVPDAHLLFSGEFKRVGSAGLKITGEDGKSFFIENYFSGETHKHLLSPDGAMLSAHIVEALAGPLAPGQSAQAGAQPAGQPVIGRVDAISGSCTAVRNGVLVSLNMGDTVRKGDVVQTSASSAISIVFTDGSTFSLSANARMVLDEFVYNSGRPNTAVISLVQGSFSFVAGQVAKTGDMKIETPVATMGIRGTAVLVEISANDGQTKFSVMVEPNGTTGSFNLYNKTTGALIATVNNSQVGWLVTPAGPLQVVAQAVNKSPAELQQELGIVQQLFNIFNNFQQNPLDPNQQQQDPSQRGNNQGQQNTGAVGSGGAPSSPTPSNINVTITQIPNINIPNTNSNTNSNTNTNTNSSSGTNTNTGTPATTTPKVPLPTGTFTVINGSDDDDNLIGTPGNDFVYAGGGNDSITAAHGGGDDFYDGGTGTDTIKYLSATNGVTFNLNSGTYTLPGGLVVPSSTADGIDVAHDIFVRIEKIVGSPGNDVFILHDNAEWEIDAGAGIDIIRFADGINLNNTDGGPDIKNFEIVDLVTDTAKNTVYFDVSDLATLGNIVPLRILAGSNDVINVGNSHGLTGTWTQVGDNIDADGVFTDGLTNGTLFDVYEWSFNGETKTVYVQDGAIINNAPTFDEKSLSIHGTWAPFESDGYSGLKLSSGAIDQEILAQYIGPTPIEGPNLIENLAATGIPTNGSIATFSFDLNAGESITAQWMFDANDYIPYDDFAFVAITYEGMLVHSGRLSSVGEIGDYNQTPWQFIGYTATQSGHYEVTFGVVDTGDGLLASDLYVANGHITLVPMVEDAAPTLTASHTVGFSDADWEDTHTATAELIGSSPLGNVSVDLYEGDGPQQIVLNYSVDNAAVQYLGAGQTLFQDIRVTLSDGNTSSYQYYTVAINGTNDAPIAQNFSTEGEVNQAVAFTLSATDDSASLVFSFEDTASMLDSGDWSTNADFSTLLDAYDLEHLAVSNPQSGMFSKTLYFRPDEAGNFDFGFSVTDVELATSASRTISFDIANGAII